MKSQDAIQDHIALHELQNAILNCEIQYYFTGFNIRPYRPKCCYKTQYRFTRHNIRSYCVICTNYRTQY